MRIRAYWHLAGILAALISLPAQAFDHAYRDYGALLDAHVQLHDNKTRGTVDYAALKKDQAKLAAVLDTWSAVEPAAFEGWSRDQQMAFLINAYNGFTLSLILTAYPDLTSIRDLGSLLRSPWKRSFFSLLGAQRSLDWLEHDTLRAHYPDPRIHFAVNCASIGCPALQPRPFAADGLDAQLDAATRQFLQDRRRNHFDAKTGTLYVTPLLRWYREDFKVNGQADRSAWLAQHAEWLADTAADRKRIRQQDFELEFTDYNWNLNDAE